jgi:hypothetical protein
LHRRLTVLHAAWSVGITTAFAALQRITAHPAIDRKPISNPSGILLHLNDGSAVLTGCAPTMPEDSNGEKDKEQAKRVYERGCEAAQGSF